MNGPVISCHNPTCSAKCPDGLRARAVGWSWSNRSRNVIYWWCPRCTKDREPAGGA